MPKGMNPGTRTHLDKGGHISVPLSEQVPLLAIFEALNYPYLSKNTDFLVPKIAPFFAEMADIFHVNQCSIFCIDN